VRELPTNLKAALLHGEFLKVCADIERVGIPLDVPTLRHLQANWDDIRIKLAGQSVEEFPFYDGVHFSHSKFEKFLEGKGLAESWPRTQKSSVRRTDKDTWKQQAELHRESHPEIEDARELFKTMSLDRLNIACDGDGRNRVVLGAFGTVTGRNAPSGSKKTGSFIFAPAKWARFLIKPPKGMALAYLDWSSQEYGICAVLSGDRNMIECYESGQPYLHFAILAGAAPPGATVESHPAIRKLYKIVTLAVGYGQKWWGLAKTAGVSEQVAKKLFEDHRRVFAKFCEWREQQLDAFGLCGEISTVLGWPFHRSSDTKPNTVINFGGQANAAEMLRLAVIETHRRGIEICGTVHDAIFIQAPVNHIQRAIRETKEAMAIASRTILNGYTLRVDCQDDRIVNRKLVRGDITRYPQRFYDEDGEVVWRKILSVDAVVRRKLAA
jgi:DNA polymerase-1